MRVSTLVVSCALGLLLWALLFLTVSAFLPAWGAAAELADCRAACVEARLGP